MYLSQLFVCIVNIEKIFESEKSESSGKSSQAED